MVLCETKREFSAASCTMWCGHICSDVGDVRCNIKYRANNKFLDIGKCTKMSFSTQAFVGLAYQGEDIVFRFITEYSSLKVIILGLFLYEAFLKMIYFGLC